MHPVEKSIGAARGEDISATHQEWLPSKERAAGTYSASDLTTVLQEACWRAEGSKLSLALCSKQ